MELILFVGIPGSGKSTFYHQRFRDTHLRINLDMLRTRHRERILFGACLEAKQPVVIDNTNPAREDRRPYMELAKIAGFRLDVYYFSADLEQCKRRNEQRPAKEQVPLVGLLGIYNRLELPSRDEGWDAMHYVRLEPDLQFRVEEWCDDV